MKPLIIDTNNGNIYGGARLDSNGTGYGYGRENYHDSKPFNQDTHLKDLYPNFSTNKPKADKPNKIIPVTVSGEKDHTDTSKTKDSKPKYQKTTRKYSDGDYSTGRRKKRGVGIEVRGGMSDMYTNALLEVFQKKRIHKAGSKGRARFVSPQQLFDGSKKGPLKMVVRVKTMEGSSLDLEELESSIVSDLMDSDDVLVGLSGLPLANNGFKEELSDLANKYGIQIAVGPKAMSEALHRGL